MDEKARSREKNKGIIRQKLSTCHILLKEQVSELAAAARDIKTGDLTSEQKNWEQESLLHEMLLYDMCAQTVEAMIKVMV